MMSHMHVVKQIHTLSVILDRETGLQEGAEWLGPFDKVNKSALSRGRTGESIRHVNLAIFTEPSLWYRAPIMSMCHL
jgi:hypothetical protein